VKEVISHHQENKYWRSMRPEEKYLKPSDESLPLDVKPGLSRQFSGAENIRTTQTIHGQDQQEYVGTENQRLPSYEIQETKDTLLRGFRKASFNLSKIFMDLFITIFSILGDRKDEVLDKPIPEEDLDFTTGLCSGPCPTSKLNFSLNY